MFKTFDMDKAIRDAIAKVTWELEHRFHYGNLKSRGWKIDAENKTFQPPVINVQEAIAQYFKRLLAIEYPENFKNYEYFSSEVIVPEAIYHDT